jgi:hypothetical protein
MSDESTASSVSPDATPVSTSRAKNTENSTPPMPVHIQRTSAVVGNGDTDEVHLASVVYKNKYARKVLTIHHLQRRLMELGYTDGYYGDKDGYYGDPTKNSVAAFQKDRNLGDNGLMDPDTFSAIFDGDPNVTVILD